MPTGKPAQIMDALFARALLMATQGPTLPVSLPEQFDPATQKGFEPPADGKYLTVQFFPNVPAWQGLASGRIDQGLLQVTVIWPKNEGVIKPAEKAQAVIDHFAKSTELFSGATKVTISGEPWASAPLPETHAVSIPVTIPWRA
jgi:hypothetical protein